VNIEKMERARDESGDGRSDLNAWLPNDEVDFVQPKGLISTVQVKESGKRQSAGVHVIVWRRLVASQDGPTISEGLRTKPSPTTRLVLLTLSVYMNAQGTCFPGQTTIAIASGLSLPAVKKHLRIAIAGGWITRKRRQRDDGTVGSYEYQATLPGAPAKEVGKRDHPRGKRGDPSRKLKLSRRIT